MQFNKLVVNLHLTYKCNMKCVFCHGTFSNSSKELKTLKDWIKVVDNINTYCKNHNKKLRINLAGGEPLLVPFIDDLIDYIYLSGIELSIITNGFYLSESFLEKHHKKLSMIGISIDSITDSFNKITGRCHNNLHPISKTDYIYKCQLINEYNVPLKINTLISKINYAEDLTTLLSQCVVSRWKVLRLQIIEGENTNSLEIQPSSDEYNHFIEKHSIYNPLVEDSGDMIDSYIIVSPSGQLVDNHNFEYAYLGSLIEHPFEELFLKTHFSLSKYVSRYE